MNFYSSSKVDTNAIVENIIFDGTNSDNNGTFHAIQFRQVRGINVANVTCHHVGDCTALISDDRSVVSDSHADAVGNVGFDHWDNPSNAIVTKSSVVCGENEDILRPIQGDGIMFTASSGHSPGHGINLSSSDNKITGNCGVGVDFNTLWWNFSISNATSIRDVVDLQGGPYLGIRMLGDIVDGRIVEPRLSGGNGGFAVGIVEDAYGGQPSGGEIIHPRITDWIVSKLNVAWIVAMGQNAKISNAEVFGGNAPSFYRFNDPSSSIVGLRAPVGRVSGR